MWEGLEGVLGVVVGEWGVGLVVGGGGVPEGVGLGVYC